MASGTQSEVPPQGWRTAQVYVMAAICLAVGLALGYLFRGSVTQVRPPAAAQPPAAMGAADSNPPQMPSLEDMKHMADKKAEPLLAKLKADPNNSILLNQIGTLYKATHQFKEAAGYYQKAVDADPKNVAARTDLASCLYYQGDADGAINQLQQSLRYEPKDANSLFNLGMIRLQGKNDPTGAVTAWQQLLKLNPTLAEDKKAAVQKLIAQARQPKVHE
ncbi:MAG TPA: tetratricopeptide repeat protein [Candidatus Sulfotelmatobacter sp.]|nr:tetratricopeptide repeat protein [Candidatus Sulfotelmatobacter sp.]